MGRAWLVSAFLACICIDASGQDHPRIILPPDASPMEQLAARELRRYIYLRTDNLLTINSEAFDGAAIRLRRKDATADLPPQSYHLRSVESPRGRSIDIIGGDDAGTLYGTYRLIEHLGIGFNLDGDVIPDERVELNLPKLNETGKPLFSLRGIQPFHDFPEGPDWWSTDHYKAVLSQLPKLRMNFFGLHTYPEGGVGPEPAVWIGLPEDIGPDGQIRFAYPSSWMNTLRGNWGYAARKTSDFAFGASQLFEADGYGSEIMTGHVPRPSTPEGYKEVFDRAGQQHKEAFTHARSIGIKTCIGTETPLVVPRLVRDRIGKSARRADPAAAQSLYEGIFTRIMRTYPLDYYWFWTPEDWTWQGVSDERVNQTVQDIQAAVDAANKVHAPFTLATCGWVLGPPKDRALFDKVLPKHMPLSCISRQVGKEKVEPGFANVQGRGKWAIPWLEDDPNLAAPQLWVGRMRKDAADALKYGCDGLMGIHWRTRVISPNAVALAHAAWDQSWNSAEPAQPATQRMNEGPEGGQYAAFNAPIAGTSQQPIYQTVRYNVDAYRFELPNGRYKVTLQFCEPHYAAANSRVFGVKLQGTTVIESLDIFARVGKNRALDFSFGDVQVSNGWLNIEFTRIVEFPSVAGIVIEGPVTRKINCGGPAWEDYAADWPPSDVASPTKDRFLPTGDFYKHWAAIQFGPEAANQIAAIFEKIDGHLPEPTAWIDGPGGIAPDPAHWNNAAKLYAFVDELAALRPRVRGAGNLERFDYWLTSFRYMKATERVKATWARLNAAMKQVAAQSDAAARARLAQEQALPIRIELVQAVAEVYSCLLATVHTPGELGTIANWEQHSFPRLLDATAAELEEAMGKPLPDEARIPKGYSGPPRIIVLTVRTSIRAGEKLELKVILLSREEPRDSALFWRNMGQGQYSKVPLNHVARGVYRVELPLRKETDAVEYYIEAVGATWPAGAPRIAQTVIVWP